jgi:hypothetical protein
MTPEPDKAEHGDVYDEKNHQQGRKDEVKRAHGLKTADYGRQ